jgi:hypothetical protein
LLKAEGYAFTVDERPIERRFRERVDFLGPEVSALLLTILRMPQDRRAVRIGELYADDRTRVFAEFLIDLEVEPAARVGIVAELRRTRAYGH